MDTTFIYALCEPDTGEVRYVGKANNPRQRLWEHMKEQRPTHKRNWLQSLKRRGLRPKIELLLEVDRADWELWEREMIVLFRSEGRLVNATGGGESGVGGNNRGKPIHPNTRAALIKSSTGRDVSEETRKKMSEAHCGKPMHDNTRQALQKSNLRRPMHENSRKALAVTNLGNKHALGCRWNIGRKHSEEHRRKNSEAQAAAWAKRKADKLVDNSS